ncbi:MAG: hypothetical protein LBE84_07660 [Planctomycetota bacterium]|jgi:hypothetical protein|nr:hypothetical protein [Planctomycetota bacterium]
MRIRPPLFLLFALGIAGCSGDGAPISAKPVNENASPDVMVKNAVETRTSLSSLAGKGVMRIVDRPNRFGLTVNADVLADESDRLRIRADKLAGSIQAFDVVKLGEDIGLYIPSQNTLYHGKVVDLQSFAFRFDPDEILRQMLRPDTALLLRRWRRVQAEPADGGDVIALEEDVPANRPRLRLVLERRTGRIASLIHLDAKGDPVLIRTYGDYRDMDMGSGEKRRARGEEPVFPYLISFNWPRDNRLMEMQFKTIEGNAIILNEDFDIAASANTRYLPLNEANMESDPVALAGSVQALAAIPAY